MRQIYLTLLLCETTLSDLLFHLAEQKITAWQLSR